MAMGSKIISTRDKWLIAALGLGFTALGLWFYMRDLPPDMMSLYLAGWFFDHGQSAEIYQYAIADLFVFDFPESWGRVAAQQGYSSTVLYPFLYPPYIAAFFAPLSTQLDVAGFSLVLYLVHLPMVFVSIFLSWRIAGQPGHWGVWFAVALGLFFVTAGGLLALAQNQLQITIVFILLLAFERYQARKMRLAGVLFAIAGSIKIAPMALGVLFLARKQGRGAGYMAAAGLLILGGSVLWVGVGLHLAYAAQIAEIGDHVYINRHNWSLYTMLYQLEALIEGVSLGGGIDVTTVETAPQWLKLVNASVLVLGVIWVWMRFRHGLKRHQEVALFVFLLTLIGLTSPLGWSHNFIPMIYFAPALLYWFSQRIGVLLIAAVFGGQMLLLQLYLAAQYTGLNWAQMAGTSAVLLGAAVFAWVSTRPEVANSADNAVS